MEYVWYWYEPSAKWIVCADEVTINRTKFTLLEIQQRCEYDAGVCAVISESKPES